MVDRFLFGLALNNLECRVAGVTNFENSMHLINVLFDIHETNA